jgi:UDP-N-acetylglucosamine 2-epimerase
MKTVVTVLGTRPEIIKLSPLIPLLREQFRHILVHSGQHYSFEMDAVFFEELGLPAPDYTLAVGSASHGEQTARMLSRLEPILLATRPDMVLVQGDTNTAMAGGLCAAKLNIPGRAPGGGRAILQPADA